MQVQEHARRTEHVLSSVQTRYVINQYVVIIWSICRWNHDGNWLYSILLVIGMFLSSSSCLEVIGGSNNVLNIHRLTKPRDHKYRFQAPKSLVTRWRKMWQPPPSLLHFEFWVDFEQALSFQFGVHGDFKEPLVLHLLWDPWWYCCYTNLQTICTRMGLITSHRLRE